MMCNRQVNAVRRAAWHARLGFPARVSTLAVPLHSVRPAGGVVPSFTAVVLRRYPTLYLDRVATAEGASRRVLTQADEDRAFSELAKRQEREHDVAHMVVDYYSDDGAEAYPAKRHRVRFIVDDQRDERGSTRDSRPFTRVLLGSSGSARDCDFTLEVC